MMHTIGDSMEWSSTLDRTPLGRFAAHSDLIAMGHNIMVLEAQVEVKDTSMHVALLSSIRRYFAEALADYDTPTSRVYGELMYWNKLSDEPVKSDHFIIAGNVSWYECLTLVVGHPKLHDYFKRDIWDVEEAYNFLEAGIDPDLALAVS